VERQGELKVLERLLVSARKGAGDALEVEAAGDRKSSLPAATRAVAGTCAWCRRTVASWSASFRSGSCGSCWSRCWWAPTGPSVLLAGPVTLVEPVLPAPEGEAGAEPPGAEPPLLALRG
jgi:hypothetical protein